MGQEIHTDRIIGHIDQGKSGPTVIFIGGIHGNEPSGVFALRQAVDHLVENKIPVRGTILALSGNLRALGRNERFDKYDLNRLWTPDRMDALTRNSFRATTDEEEQFMEIHGILEDVCRSARGPVYFFDLHSTSVETIPFLTINDSLLNRKFARQYPAPIILGIEEYLNGPLLSYYNDQGYVSFGFEGGQHDNPETIKNHLAFIFLTMCFAGSIPQGIIDFDDCYDLLYNNSRQERNFYEIYHRYEIREGEDFMMRPGFTNFQSIAKNEVLAVSDGVSVKSNFNTKIFMPLYQKKGNDGFFLIRNIHPFFLTLSKFLRKLRFDRIISLLPGIQWKDKRRDTLIVNLKVAWMLTKPLLHLMGYRSKYLDKNHLIIRNREAASRDSDYKKEPWYRK